MPEITQDYLDKIERLMENLKFLPEIVKLLEQNKTAVQQVSKPQQAVVGKRQTENTLGIAAAFDEKSSPDYEENLKSLKELLMSDQWPVAVDQDLICDETSVEDKMQRAEGIIDFTIEEDVENKSILDFGCHEGYLVAKLLERKPKNVMGYDITDYDWKGKENLSTNWSDVIAKGPYDIVVIYDVLDHLDGNQLETLNMIKSVMRPGGRLYIRCHPFCSRHATHLYKTINKAYMHLCFSEEEIKGMGYTDYLPTLRVLHPHATYKDWFSKVGFNLVIETPTHENVEDFFYKEQLVSKRIKSNWRTTTLDADLASGKTFPNYQMRIQFIDYILKA